LKELEGESLVGGDEKKDSPSEEAKVHDGDSQRGDQIQFGTISEKNSENYPHEYSQQRNCLNA